MDRLALMRSDGKVVVFYLSRAGEDLGASYDALPAPGADVIPQQTLELQPDGRSPCDPIQSFQSIRGIQAIPEDKLGLLQKYCHIRSQPAG